MRTSTLLPFIVAIGAIALLPYSALAQCNAGFDAGPISSCTTSPAYILTTGGDPGGSWQDPTGIAHSGTLDPAVDIAGTYLYIIPAGGPCTVADTASFIVGLSVAANAGLSGSVTLCSTDTALMMFDELNGTPQFSGFWIDPTGAPHAAAFVPGFDAPGVYTYTVTGAAPCPSSSAALTVVTNVAPNGGQNGTLSISASTGMPTDLFNHLNGTPDAGGNWTDPTGAVFTNPFDPAVHSSGCYTYEVAGAGPCVAATATVCVVITPGQAPITPTTNYPTY